MSNGETPPTDPKRIQRALGHGLVLLGIIIAALTAIGSIPQFAYRPFVEVLPDLVEVFIGLAIFGGLPILLGRYLMKRAGPAPAQTLAVAGQRQPMGAMRLVFAIFGALIMLFSGGCGLVFLGSYIADLGRQGGSASYVGWEVILLFAGPPFLAGLLIWWLAARVGRR